ncbi:hypothetical protein CBR_g30676 [Chara braunii]|uniref:EF-hand domain-containing protein n=1 Tax=Chara braunii TaxID=69332 RepID=A0A388LDD4_CHABU|nr:hypothetical protein CBR_g30676 [Chara braunii]|eukprot:GBG80308.1 hypothetical protein CBR_g30676 [Chara braunii]
MATHTSDHVLQQWFASVDMDRSGAVNADELRRALAVGNLHFPMRTISQMIRMYDRDSSGQISFNEFVQLHNFLCEVSESFYAYDRDRNGVLTFHEILDALKRLKFNLEYPALQSACQLFDPSRTGMLKMDDYISLCCFLQLSDRIFKFYDPGNQGTVNLNFSQFVFCAGQVSS